MRWGMGGASAAFLLVLLFTMLWRVRLETPGGGHLLLADHGTVLFWNHSPAEAARRTARPPRPWIEPIQTVRFNAAPDYHIYSSTRWFVRVPLWIPVVGFGIPSVIAWTVRRRRRIEGLCPSCGYPLEGLPPDETGRVRCPECGGRG